VDKEIVRGGRFFFIGVKLFVKSGLWV